MLHLYRRLLRLRGSSAALRAGTLELLDSPAGVLTYRRASGDDDRIVAVNFSPEVRHIPHAGRVVDVASDGIGETAVFDGALRPSQAVVLGRYGRT